MAITLSYARTRQNVTVDFLGNINFLSTSSDSVSPNLLNGIYACISPFFTSGNTVCNVSYSEDGLTQTTSMTFDTLDTFSNYQNTMQGNLSMISTHRNWLVSNGNDVVLSNAFTKLDGIANAFTWTNTYKFPPLTPEQYSPTAIQAVFSTALQSTPQGKSNLKDICLELSSENIPEVRKTGELVVG